jgi:hypothetical protein
MANRPTVTPARAPGETPDDVLELLRQEYEAQQTLFAAQPAIVQRFLEAQVRSLAEAIIQRAPQARFTLPDRVAVDPPPAHVRLHAVPKEVREQIARGLIDRLTGTDVGDAVRQRLNELSQSTNRAIGVAAELVRHATAIHMVHGMLPAGRHVQYVAADGEEIPTNPVVEDVESAITEPTDAIAEETERVAGRGELQAPFVPAQRRFFLPQWVAFDDEARLLVGSLAEAEARIASMQRYLAVLHAAVALGAYIIADPEYQRKRAGMLGQLINQGRALARYQTEEIIATIRRRADANDLNRGLSISLPYFDDQDLELRQYPFTVIPPGRIMFVPAFVVRAVRDERVKVAQDTRLNASTRKYLLAELKRLELAFDSSAPRA